MCCLLSHCTHNQPPKLHSTQRGRNVLATQQVLTTHNFAVRPSFASYRLPPSCSSLLDVRVHTGTVGSEPAVREYGLAEGSRKVCPGGGRASHRTRKRGCSVKPGWRWQSCCCAWLDGCCLFECGICQGSARMTDVSLLQEQTTPPCGGDKNSLSQTRSERCSSPGIIRRQSRRSSESTTHLLP